MEARTEYNFSSLLSQGQIILVDDSSDTVTHRHLGWSLEEHIHRWKALGDGVIIENVFVKISNRIISVKCIPFEFN